MTPARSEKLGVIAGGGNIPPAVVRAAQAAGREVFVVALEGEASPESAALAACRLPLTEIAAIIRVLKEQQCREVVIIGGVARPGLSGFAPPATPPALIERALALARDRGAGDDVLLSSLIAYLEEVEGFQITGADEASPALRAGAGLLAGPPPEKAHRRDIEHGLRIVRQLGALDIGQAVVVCRGLVLGVEAVEGTAALLERVARLPAALRGTGYKRAGVLIKAPRPGQDLRVDMPAIGPDTIAAAVAAGLAGVAAVAGGVLLCEREEMRRKAEAQSVFIEILPWERSGEAGSG